MSRRIGVSVGVALALALMGCATSEKITTREELTHMPPERPITVYAVGDRVYVLHPYALADTMIHGTGTLSVRRETTAFEGDIPFSQIIAIKTDSRSFAKGLLVVGITAMFIAYAAEGVGSHTGLVPTVGTSHHEPSGGGGSGSSCPYVYAWDGSSYVLQAEPFGVALGRGLELTTRHLLPAARAEHGIVRLRLTNERRETHYVNSIGVSRIELGAARAAVLDGAGAAWPLTNPIAPVAARDRLGHDILSSLATADGRFWECDPSSLTADSGYEDVLELAFVRPSRVRTASLVVTGINTELSTALYGELCRVVGDQTPALAHAVETDPVLIAELREYTRDASLTASVWNGRDWKSAGALQPEANAVTFTRALRIQLPGDAGDTVRVRLRSMADVWRIDAIAVDWGDARTLAMTPLRLESATGPGNEDLRRDLAEDDRHYAILVPPDRVDLAFSDRDAGSGARVAYAVSGRGYLMEWDPPRDAGGVTALASAVPADARIALLEEGLKHRELILEPAYQRWRKQRARADAHAR